jgi:hypothetical protein
MAPFSGVLIKASLRPALPFLIQDPFHLSLAEIIQTSTTIYDFKPSHGILYTIYPERSEVLGTGKPR